MSRLVLWAVWYWRIMSRPTTRTFPQVFVILSNMNASITSGTPHCLSVPPLVSIYLSFVASLILPFSNLWKWCTTKNHLTTNADFGIRTVWSRTDAKAAWRWFKPVSEISIFSVQASWSLRLPLKGSFKHGLSCCPSSVTCSTRRTTTLVRSAHQPFRLYSFLLSVDLLIPGSICLILLGIAWIQTVFAKVTKPRLEKWSSYTPF